jgi:hypothetical protein
MSVDAYDVGFDGNSLEHAFEAQDAAVCSLTRSLRQLIQEADAIRVHVQSCRHVTDGEQDLAAVAEVVAQIAEVTPPHSVFFDAGEAEAMADALLSEMQWARELVCNGDNYALAVEEPLGDAMRRALRQVEQRAGWLADAFEFEAESLELEAASATAPDAEALRARALKFRRHAGRWRSIQGRARRVWRLHKNLRSIALRRRVWWYPRGLPPPGRVVAQSPRRPHGPPVIPIDVPLSTTAAHDVLAAA